MTTIRINAYHDASATVYAVVFRLSDGKVFDWADSTWKLIGAPPTTPNVALTQLVAFGAGLAEYAANLNLSTINATITPVDISVKFFRQAGGSPAPATDEYLGEIESFSVVAGNRVGIGFGTLPVFAVIVVVDTTTTAGDSAHVKVQLCDQRGQLIDLDTLDPSATCAVDVIEDGGTPQFSLSTSDFGPPTSDGWFEDDYANPGFSGDTGYTAIATVVTGGMTFTGVANVNVWA